MANLFQGIDKAAEADTKVIAVRVKADVHAAFQQACERNSLAMSSALAFIVPAATSELNERADAIDASEKNKPAAA